jgi:polyisoprenoid-binding protein YceI
MKLKALSLIILVLQLVSSHAHATMVIPVQSSQGRIEFHAVGRPSMIKVNGEAKGPDGTLNIDGAKVSGDLTFDMTSLESGIGMRDDHMKNKYLEVGKYPQAKLHLTEVSLPEKWSAKAPAAKDVPFKGELTLHGQTKPVAGKFDLTGDAGKINAKANFEINIAEYGIDIPKYLGITIKNEVPVELTLSDLKAK